MNESNSRDERMLPLKVLEMYESWRAEVNRLTFDLSNDPEFKDSEDLGDWVESICTLLSFSPQVMDGILKYREEVK